MTKKTATTFLLLVAYTIAYSEDMPHSIKYSVEVGFAKIHDPGFIVLTLPDGNAIDAAYSGVDYDTLDRWQSEKEQTGKARKLQLSYSNEKGVQVYDKETGVGFCLDGFIKNHPIDLAEKELLTKYSSTVGMVHCQNLALKAWDAELNRAYKNLGGTKNNELKQAQLAWIRFRDAQTEYFRKEYLSRSGSIWQIVYMGHVVDLTKSQANLLKSIKDW